jgi:hypothetical protein
VGEGEGYIGLLEIEIDRWRGRGARTYAARTAARGPARPLPTTSPGSRRSLANVYAQAHALRILRHASFVRLSVGY